VEGDADTGAVLEAACVRDDSSEGLATAADGGGAVVEGADPPQAAADRTMPALKSAISLLVLSTS
jgi:hypothetical protein